MKNKSIKTILIIVFISLLISVIGFIAYNCIFKKSDKLDSDIHNSTNNSISENTNDLKSKQSRDDNKESKSNNKTNFKISEEKALELTKEKLKKYIKTEYLKLGNDKYGMSKMISYKKHDYYCIYWSDEEVTADYRFCVDANTGEVFYQDVSDLNKFMPIDEYITSLRKF